MILHRDRQSQSAPKDLLSDGPRSLRIVHSMNRPNQSRCHPKATRAPKTKHAQSLSKPQSKQISHAFQVHRMMGDLYAAAVKTRRSSVNSQPTAARLAL